MTEEKFLNERETKMETEYISYDGKVFDTENECKLYVAETKNKRVYDYFDKDVFNLYLKRYENELNKQYVSIVWQEFKNEEKCKIHLIALNSQTGKELERQFLKKECLFNELDCYVKDMLFDFLGESKYKNLSLDYEVKCSSNEENKNSNKISTQHAPDYFMRIETISEKNKNSINVFWKKTKIRSLFNDQKLFFNLRYYLKNSQLDKLLNNNLDFLLCLFIEDGRLNFGITDAEETLIFVQDITDMDLEDFRTLFENMDDIDNKINEYMKKRKIEKAESKIENFEKLFGIETIKDLYKEKIETANRNEFIVYIRNKINKVLKEKYKIASNNIDFVFKEGRNNELYLQILKVDELNTNPYIFKTYNLSDCLLEDFETVLKEENLQIDRNTEYKTLVFMHYENYTFESVKNELGIEKAFEVLRFFIESALMNTEYLYCGSWEFEYETRKDSKTNVFRYIIIKDMVADDTVMEIDVSHKSMMDIYDYLKNIYKDYIVE